MPWLRKLVPDSCAGGMPGRATDWVAHAIQLEIEMANFKKTPLAVLSIDFYKCFDTLPRDLIIEVAVEMGMDARVAKTLMTWYEGMARRFRIANVLGEQFSTDKGLIQGDALSVVLAIIWSDTWSMMVRKEQASKLESVYIADLAGVISRWTDCKELIRLTNNFALVWQVENQLGKVNVGGQ